MASDRLVLLPGTTRKAGWYTETIYLKTVKRCCHNENERQRSLWRGRLQRDEGITATAFNMRAYVDSELEGVRVGAENLEFAPAEASAMEQRNQQIFCGDVAGLGWVL